MRIRLYFKKINEQHDMKKIRLMWHDSYRLGISAIDRQHKEIVEEVNGIIASLEAETDYGLVREQIGRFIQHMREHFALEEWLMRQHGFPGSAEHVARHDQLLDQLGNVCMSLCVPNPSITKIELFVVFLAEWTELHISHDDRELGKFLTQHRAATLGHASI